MQENKQLQKQTQQNQQQLMEKLDQQNPRIQQSNLDPMILL